NHLHRFSEWKQVFFFFSAHLEPGGAFIFDINTEHGLSTYPDEAPVIIRGQNNFMTIEYYHQKKSFIDMQVTIFEQQLDQSFQKLEATITERSFPRERVDFALRTHFKEVRVQDPENRRVTRWSNELLYTCIKSPSCN
ncbi:MAG: hypothetical protein KDD62_14130, partial [Bdellovibrionales bacterium]|nr:hypothetical protein [Bdellovibrionales bacterium]